MNLPRTWSRMDFTAKAAWLCSSCHSKDYSDACRMLAKLPRKPRPRDIRSQVVADMERRKLW